MIVVSAGDYPRGDFDNTPGYWHGNHSIYDSIQNNSRPTGEPIDHRFVGRSYDNDIKHIHPPSHWWRVTNYSWYGVTDIVLPLPYIEIVSEDSDYHHICRWSSICCRLSKW